MRINFFWIRTNRGQIFNQISLDCPALQYRKYSCEVTTGTVVLFCHLYLMACLLKPAALFGCLTTNLARYLIACTRYQTRKERISFEMPTSPYIFSSLKGLPTRLSIRARDKNICLVKLLSFLFLFFSQLICFCLCSMNGITICYILILLASFQGVFLEFLVVLIRNMKSMNDNWLGFSLSSSMNMDASSDPHHRQDHTNHHHHQTLPSFATTTTVPCNIFHSPQTTNSGICYGMEGADNEAILYPQLSVMPLKSDGSLCIMEALSRSQQQGQLLSFFYFRHVPHRSDAHFDTAVAGMVPSPSPKLEDFLGGAPHMGIHHHFVNNDSEAAMALSLDYSKESDSQANRNHSLGLLHRQHQLYFQPLHEGLCNEMYDVAMEEGSANGEGISSLKSWVNSHYNGGNNGYCEETALGSDPVGTIEYGNLQPLSLSMSPGSQSSCVTPPLQSSAATQCMALDVPKKRGAGKVAYKQPVHRKSIDTFGQRTSQYRGVTRSVFFFFSFNYYTLLYINLSISIALVC